MLRAALALLLLVTGTAGAEQQRTHPLSQTLCLLAQVQTDEGRGEIVPYLGASFGGGLDAYRNVGGLSRLHFADGWVMELQAHKASAERRLELPMPVLQTRRLGGGSLGVGYTPFVGKFLVTKTWIVKLDVVAALGAGIVFVRTPQASAKEFDDRFALTASVTMRFRIQPWLSLNIGIHDEALPIGDTPSRTTARAIDQPVVLPATTHELEVRFGLGFWIPDAPGRTCRAYCR
jgi:hypothetical protein